jgi:hypothetical protein
MTDYGEIYLNGGGQGCGIYRADVPLDLLITALACENLFDHVFQVRISKCKGLEDGIAA